MIKRLVSLAFIFIFSIVSANEVPEELKNKTITVIVPYGPGGNSDISARLLAKKFEEKTGLNTIVINKAGASGSIGANFVANSKPDGLTLCQCESTPVILNNLMGIPGSPEIGQLLPISVSFTNSLGVYVNSAAPFNDLRGFFKWVKENNIKLNYAAAATTQTLWSEILLSQENITGHQNINYKSDAESIQSVITGQTNFAILSYNVAKTHVDNGLLKPIAVGDIKRLKELPNVKTVSEDYKDLTFINYNGIFAAKNTPKKIVEYVNAQYNRVLEDQEIIAIFTQRGNNLVGGDTIVAQRFLDNFYRDRKNLWTKFGHLIK